jgi:sporulation protein YlmC with PRC-barrel domain
MAKREVNVERLLSRRVLAANGRVIGRLEEFEVEIRGSECYVSEYLLGVYALFERLAAWNIGRAMLRLLPGAHRGYRVPYDQLDLSDPHRPRLRCSVDELAALDKDR